jgi:hypothetical protein
MNIKSTFRLIFAIVIFTSCTNTKEKFEFQDSDKREIVFQKNLLSSEYLRTVEFKNNIYSKSIDSLSKKIIYEYESELWENSERIGGIVSSTFEHPLSNLKNMNEVFLSFILGENLKLTISKNIRYERTYEYNLPFEKYRVYNLITNDSIMKGYIFTVLKENKIIFTSFYAKDSFDIKIDKLINRLNEI